YYRGLVDSTLSETRRALARRVVTRRYHREKCSARPCEYWRHFLEKQSAEDRIYHPRCIARGAIDPTARCCAAGNDNSQSKASSSRALAAVPPSQPNRKASAGDDIRCNTNRDTCRCVHGFVPRKRLLERLSLCRPDSGHSFQNRARATFRGGVSPGRAALALMLPLRLGNDRPDGSDLSRHRNDTRPRASRLAAPPLAVRDIWRRVRIVDRWLHELRQRSLRFSSQRNRAASNRSATGSPHCSI